MKSNSSPVTSKPPRLRVDLKDVSQPEFSAAVRAHMGKQRVSIMLDGEVVAFFKAKAGERGYLRHTSGYSAEVQVGKTNDGK